MSKFFVVGDMTADLMYFVDELPEAGGEVTVTRSVTEPGGAGGTIASVLAQLGHEVSIATRIGTGPFSDLALTNVKATGVNTDAIQRDNDLPTSSVVIFITPDAQRTMISSPGASRHLDAAQLDPKKITDSDALIMSAYSLIGGQQRDYALKAFDIARDAGVTTFIDMGSGAVHALKDRLISVVRDVDYLLMNQQELFTLTGEGSISDAVAGLAAHGIERVIVKVGEMGSIVITPELTELIEGISVDDVVNSAGAGDYYTAAFAHAIMEGYDLHHAARLGNVAGGLSVMQVGAQGTPMSAEILERHAKAMLSVEAG